MPYKGAGLHYTPFGRESAQFGTLRRSSDAAAFNFSIWCSTWGRGWLQGCNGESVESGSPARRFDLRAIPETSKSRISKTLKSDSEVYPPSADLDLLTILSDQQNCYQSDTDMKWIFIGAVILAIASTEAPGLGAVSGGSFISATMLYIYRDIKDRGGKPNDEPDA